MQSIFEFDPDSFKAFALEHDLPAFTGTQVFQWVYRRGELDLEKMTDLSRRAKAALKEHVAFGEAITLADRLASDGTHKLLLGWPEVGINPALKLLEEEPSLQTECVMIPSDARRTGCISSQVGCPVGCLFCASGQEGLEGNLSRGRIVEQAWRLGQMEDVGRLTNIVFMGMGEPLANYGPVTRAIRSINAPWGLGIGARKITLSTVGLPAAIRRFASFDIPVTLALSLHAPNDELRRTIIPWAEYAPIDELLDACDEYFQQSGREITLEYVLLRNVNDRPEHAEELANVARRLRSNINLIRYNEVEGLPFERPQNDDVHTFQAILRAKKVNTHIRASRGRDIEAACGQLRYERTSRGSS